MLLSAAGENQNQAAWSPFNDPQPRMGLSCFLADLLSVPPWSAHFPMVSNVCLTAPPPSSRSLSPPVRPSVRPCSLSAHLTKEKQRKQGNEDVLKFPPHLPLFLACLPPPL